MKYLCIFLSFFLINCKNRNQKDFLVKVSSINIPLKEKANIEGHFIENNEDLFFVYTSNTKKLIVYNKEKAIDSIDFYKSKLEVNQIVVKNTDSIFIIDYSTRIIRHINIRGQIINEIDYRKLSHQDSINPYLFKNPESISKNNIFLDVGIEKNKFKNIPHRDLINKHKSLPRFIQIKENDVFYSDFNYNNVEKKSNKNKNDLFVDYSNISLSNKYIAYTMQFSNHIYLFDYNLKLVKSVPIKSEFTGTDVNSDYSFYNKKEDRGDIYVKNYDYATLTKYIVYNKYKNRFYVLLAHKTDILKKENLIFKRSNRNFSIIEYDENFNKLNEQKFEKGLYDIYKPMFIDSNGNLLLNANNEMNPNFTPDTLRYDVYKTNN